MLEKAHLLVLGYKSRLWCGLLRFEPYRWGSYFAFHYYFFQFSEVPRDPGVEGVRVLAKTGILRRSAALMGPPFLYQAKLVVYVQFLLFGGSWRK